MFPSVTPLYTGVGCTKAHADSWIGHQDDFNSLLANLNSSVVPKEETVKVTQLEKKSKSSRKRVQYVTGWFISLIN